MSLTNNQILQKVINYLFLLMPFFLITGPFLSDLALTIISLFTLIYIIKKKDYKYLKNKFFIFFLFFYLYLITNSLFNNLNFDSIKISITYIRYGLFVIGTIYILNSQKNLLEILYKIYLICFSLLIFDGFYQFFTGYNILGFPLANGPRVSSFFNDELILGSYLSRSFPIFFALMVYHYKKISNTYYIYSCIVFILSEVLVFLSGERAAFFYMTLSSFFILIAIKDFKKLRFIIFILSILIIVIISITFPNTKKRIVDYSLTQMHLKKGSEDILIFSKQHNDLYETAINIYKDNKIFGVGVKNFRKFCDDPKYKASEISCNIHPHNSYLQILSELGLIGFTFISFLLLYFIVYVFFHLKKLLSNSYFFNDFEVCLLSAFLIYLWPIVPTGNIFNNWLNIISYYPLGIFFWSLSKKNSDNYILQNKKNII